MESNAKKTIKVNAFGHIVEREEIGIDCSDHILKQYEVKLDKETGETNIVISGEIDLNEVIQSYKDECGMEMALKMIKTGQVAPDAFADDGTSSIDCCALPRTLNEAKAAAETAEGAAIAKTLGITSDMTEEQITEAVSKAITAALGSQKQEDTK